MFRSTAAFASLTALGTLASLVGCSRGSSPFRAPEDASQRVQTDVKPDAPQKRELGQGLESQLTADLTPFFTDAYAQSLGSAAGAQTKADRLGRATAFAVARSISAKAQGSTPTACRFDLFDLNAWSKCVLQEVLQESLADGGSLRALLVSVAKAENAKVLGDIASLTSLVNAQGVALDKTAALVSEVGQVEKLLSRVVKSLEGVKGALEILSRSAALADAPFLSDSFFQGRKFVLTTSFAQGSVGSERMYNLSSHLVRLEVNSGRLVVIRDGAELFDSENGVDLILDAYPILKSIKVGKETYHQVDLAHSENKQFLVPHLAVPGAQLSLSADVVVPRVAHGKKDRITALNSGLHFSGADASLVVDKLVLVNGTDPVLSLDSETDPLSLDKDTLRPTVRVVQGLFAVDASNDAFATTQARDVNVASANLIAAGVNDVSKSGSPEDAGNVPWFTSGKFLLDGAGRARESVESVRKFSASKEIVWVVSASTPAKAVPVIKSAVLSYQRLFHDLTPKGKTPVDIKVFTQAEFEAANRDAGLRLGTGPLHAADPRVNMILWDESQLLGSAWATAAANPRTGEVISADVMLSGHMWAKEGCLSFFQKTWAFKDEPNSTRRKKGPVPSAGTKFVWEMRCEAELYKLGFYRPQFDPAADGTVDPANPFPFPIADDDAIVRATRSHDTAALAGIAAHVLGRPVTEAEMRGERASSGSEVRYRADGELDETSLPVHVREARKAIRGYLTQAQSVKGTLAKAAERAATLKATPSARGFVSLKSGKNSLKTFVDCDKTVVPGSGLDVADGGTPAILDANVKTPAEGALALLRSTLVHELGHGFGLRHNFAGSLQSAAFEEGVTPATPVQARADSVMDYNDYAIDFSMGQMQDYASETGAWETPSFGVYDVLALGTAYDLDLSSFKFKQKPTFCTDGNVKLLGNCQRFDFGKDFNEFSLHDLNMNLARLANIQASDLILMDVNSLILPRLGRVLQGLQKVTALWAIAQHAAHGITAVDDKKAALATAELGFHGVGAQQDFVKGFEGRMGRKLFGLIEFADLPASTFDEPLFADLFNEFIRSEVALNIAAFNEALRAKDLADSNDDGLFTAIHDVGMGAEVFPYRSALLNLAAGRILVPAGTPLSAVVFDDGLKDASALTVDGKPLVVTLDAPFFNHRGQLAILKNVLVDDAANPGQKISKVLRITGKENLAQMVSDASLVASLSPGWSASPSALRLATDAQALRGILEGSQTCAPGTATCYRIAGDATRAAGFMLDTYLEAATIASRPSN